MNPEEEYNREVLGLGPNDDDPAQIDEVDETKGTEISEVPF